MGQGFHVKVWKHHSTATRLPRKALAVCQQLASELKEPPLSQEEAFQRAVAKGLFAGLSGKTEGAR